MWSCRWKNFGFRQVVKTSRSGLGGGCESRSGLREGGKSQCVEGGGGSRSGLRGGESSDAQTLPLNPPLEGGWPYTRALYQTWNVLRGSITKGLAIVKLLSTNVVSRVSPLPCRLPTLLDGSSGDHACVKSNCPQSPCRLLTLIKCSDFCLISFDSEWAATTP